MFKKKIRNAAEQAWRFFSRTDGTPFGVDPRNEWIGPQKEKNILILVHGLHSSPERFAAFEKDVNELNIPFGYFRYPNDQPIHDSAALLSKELKSIRNRHPDRGITILTSSMGGLVARAVIEDGNLDPGNVKKLVMIAPPTHGSSLARFAFALELWEHTTDDSSLNPLKRLYGSIEDGLGEAARDLRPGSVFLQRLNALPRNKDVRYALILGSGAWMSEEAVDKMKCNIKSAGASNRLVRFFGKKMNSCMDDLDEVIAGRGDGAVSIERGRLEGVEDTLILPFDHLSMLGGQKLPVNQSLREAILTRIKD